MNASNAAIMYEFPSEEVDMRPFESNDILWLKYFFCPLKCCFFAICFWCGKILFNWHVIQSLHCKVIFIEIGAFGKLKILMKIEYVFSDPTCLFEFKFKESDM